MGKRGLAILLAGIGLLLALGFEAGAKNFTKKEINDARYRQDEHARLLQLAYEAGDILNQAIFGQEAAIRFVQNQLVQYLESFQDRKNEPQAVNLAGLSGIGKSAIVNKLMEMGFPIVHFDAQKYSQDQYDSFSRDLANRLRPFISEKRPVILVIEEIDKVPEVGQSQEKSNSLIGALNQILSSGKLSTSYETMDLSNVMVITDMNISPEFIESFSSEVLKTDKRFFDYTAEDIARLDEWLRHEPSATYKILSKTFRNNTVGRLAPITTVMSPLSQEAYRRITQQMIDGAVNTITQGSNTAKHVTISFDESLTSFIREKSTFAPSGARETVARSKLLAEQLINFAVKARDPQGSVDRPRRVHLSFDHERGEAVVSITPRKLVRGKLEDLEEYQVRVGYDSASKTFVIPHDQMEIKRPAESVGVQAKKAKPVSQKQILATRYPRVKRSSGEVRDYLNRHVLGQELAVQAIDEDVQRFLGQAGNTVTSPNYRILAGFPGIGKSELMKRLAEKLGLPLIKINMQRYAAAGDDAVKNFMKDVSRSIDAHRQEPGGKFILLIEEMDKLFEIDPNTGLTHDRPVMAVLKDLMNDGVVTIRDDYGPVTIDIRGNLTYFTMNFSVDRFKFSADPRLTSIDDVISAWRRMNGTAMSVKEVLGSMFMPDTVSRMMPRFMILKPLEQNDYERIILQQVDEVLRARFVRPDGTDVGQVELSLTGEYKKYLAGETIIPSEGARNTAVSARALISAHLEKTLAQIQRSSERARKPVAVTLHFRPGRKEVVGSVRLQSEPEGAEEVIFKEAVALTFPSLKVRSRLTPHRLLVSAHEFGHAFARVRMGLRLEHVVVTSPKPGVGGYVKFKAQAFSAHEIIADIYSTLAARAFERIVLSEDPLQAVSTLSTTAGASSDIQQATLALYNLIYELGLDPNGGIIDRNFVMGPSKYASYQDLPPEMAEALGLILRDMENEILRDFLSAHSLEWYVEKIAALAHEGAMDEKQFYDLTGYAFPGAARGQASVMDNARMRELFAGHITPLPAEQARAQDNQSVVIEKLVRKFAEFADRRLRSCEDDLRP